MEEEELTHGNYEICGAKADIFWETELLNSSSATGIPTGFTWAFLVDKSIEKPPFPANPLGFQNLDANTSTNGRDGTEPVMATPAPPPPRASSSALAAARSEASRLCGGHPPQGRSQSSGTCHFCEFPQPFSRIPLATSSKAVRMVAPSHNWHHYSTSRVLGSFLVFLQRHRGNDAMGIEY